MFKQIVESKFGQMISQEELELAIKKVDYYNGNDNAEHYVYKIVEAIKLNRNNK